MPCILLHDLTRRNLQGLFEMRGCDFSGPTHRWQHDSLILLLRNALKDDSNYELHLKKGQKVIRDPNLILDLSFVLLL